jgi:hypothetical protein
VQVLSNVHVDANNCHVGLALPCAAGSIQRSCQQVKGSLIYMILQYKHHDCPWIGCGYDCFNDCPLVGNKVNNQTHKHTIYDDAMPVKSNKDHSLCIVIQIIGLPSESHCNC